MNDVTSASPAKKKFRQMSIMDTMSKAGKHSDLLFFMVVYYTCRDVNNLSLPDFQVSRKAMPLKNQTQIALLIWNQMDVTLSLLSSLL